VPLVCNKPPVKTSRVPSPSGTDTTFILSRFYVDRVSMHIQRKCVKTNVEVHTGLLSSCIFGSWKVWREGIVKTADTIG